VLADDGNGGKTVEYETARRTECLQERDCRPGQYENEGDNWIAEVTKLTWEMTAALV